MITENRIIVGVDVFDKLLDILNPMYVSDIDVDYFDYKAITVVKSDMLEPNQMVTFDKALVDILKELNSKTNT